MRILSILLVASLSLAATASAKPPYYDLTGQFATFVDKTRAMESKARIAAFRARMNALFPGFYEPRFGASSEQYDKQVARALNGFDAARPEFDRARQYFPVAYAAGLKHFRAVFPGFKPNVPVYLLHSLGEMDGGVREIRGKDYLVFGADVIGRIHDSRDIGPFLDHELFHVENGKYFAECEALWCGLWLEGLATYAAKAMNPGADDRQLMLNFPKPIRAATDAVWASALCLTRAKAGSTKQDDYMDFLAASNNPEGQFAQRFGYYVGLRVMEELAATHPLAELAHMTNLQAKPLFEASLDRLIERAGGCQAPA